jgi:hypothetical protein
MRIVSYLIEYLGEFELIFETILDYESGEQMGSFDAKKPPSKISCLGTFKRLLHTPSHRLRSSCKVFQKATIRYLPVLQGNVSTLKATRGRDSSKKKKHYISPFLHKGADVYGLKVNICILRMNSFMTIILIRSQKKYFRDIAP